MQYDFSESRVITLRLCCARNCTADEILQRSENERRKKNVEFPSLERYAIYTMCRCVSFDGLQGLLNRAALVRYT